MKTQDVIEECRAKMMPRFEELAQRISSEVPHVRAQAFEGSIGAATTYRGHHFGVECFLPDASPDEPDNVALCVDVGTMDGVLFISADVIWGEGCVEAQLLPDRTPASDAALSEIVSGLPQLGSVLLEAARRGKPHVDNS